MKTSIILILIIPHIILAEQKTVRVAAIQCPSIMGETKTNLHTISNLTQKAAMKGAKIIVFPECTVQGYMFPPTWASWSKTKKGKYDVSKIAEPIPGPSTKILASIAVKEKIYLCIGLIESSSNVFFNAQVLISPTGDIIAHHRKKSLWTPGDSTWCTAGKLPVQVVNTEFGRLGLMICYDFHSLPPLLAKNKADIVLYSVGWYGPNEKNWFSNIFPRKAVIPYGFNIIVANWTSETQQQAWPGRGHSCIISSGGKILAMSESTHGNTIVMADLPINNNHTNNKKIHIRTQK